MDLFFYDYLVEVDSCMLHIFIYFSVISVIWAFRIQRLAIGSYIQSQLLLKAGIILLDYKKLPIS